MKNKLTALLVILFSITAQAEAIMWCMNTEGGKIILTDEKCTNKSGNIAYILGSSNQSTTMGCWTSDSMAIHVLWSERYLRSYDYNGWTIVNKNNPSTM
jgi:hypothetical protein